MPSFSKKSLHQLSTCDPRWKDILKRVVRYYDCTVIQGHRGEAEQNQYFYTGRSKVKFPNSKHNTYPSLAVDVAPYIKGRGIPWPQIGSRTYVKDSWEFVYFAGHLVATARAMGHEVRWGGDWDKNHILQDNKFDDLVHFELVD